jgi:GT2 family glycosyltransferase
MRQPGDISVVICTYSGERWTDLRAAVQSVQSQRSPACEIIVVVDHNPDLLERVRGSLPGIIAVENHEARGLSGARNTGIATASGALIAFLDDDARARPDWLERLAALYSQPEVLGAGGAIEPVWSGGRPSWFPEEYDWVVGCTYRGMPEQQSPVRNLIGCNMSFRRSVLVDAGGFCNGLGRLGARPLGCEETEFSIRVLQRHPEGILLYDPEATVQHQVPAQRAAWRYFRSRCYAEGLSKAAVTRLVGARHGLSSEGIYVMRTLPRGIWRGLETALRQDDPAGLARAGAIVAGLAITGTGYLVGRLAAWLPGPERRREPRPAPPLPGAGH